MAQVPYTGAPTVTPEQSGTPYEHIDTPLAAFGGATAEATQRLGGAIDKTGNELYARAIAMQQLNQRAEAAEAVAKFTTAMGEKYANYRSLEGNAAVKGYQPYIDDLNSTRESIGNGLTSEYARKTYLQESRSIQARSVFSAAAHMGDQNKKFIVGAQTAKIQSFIDGSANSPADENSYRAAIKEIDGSRSMIQTVGGLSDVETDQKIKDMKSALVFKRATALGLEQPRAAQKFLDQAMKGGIINSEQAGRAARFLRTQNLNVSTRIETAKLMSGDSDAWGQGTLSRTRALSALRGVESSDNYNQIHPDVTHKVNGETVTEHGLGAYGIMQSNLQPWLKEAGMKPMTEQEFLANPKAQDDLAWFKFNQYQTQNGTANEAFKRWRGLGGKDLASGETEAQYMQKVGRKLAQNASVEEVDNVARRVSKSIAPGDLEFEDVFSHKVRTDHAADMQIQREQRVDSLNTINQALAPAPDGKLPTQIDFNDPKVAQAWDRLTNVDKEKFRARLTQNAIGGYTETPENQAMFQKYVGQILDSRKSDEDAKGIWKIDPQTLPLPHHQIDQLVDLQRKALKASYKDTTVEKVLNELGDTMDRVKINKNQNKDEYYKFIGTAKLLIEQQMTETKKPITPDEIRAIGQNLLTKISHPGTVFGNFWKGSDIPTKVPVPTSKIPGIIAEIQKDNPGLQPTAKQIQQVYAAKLYTETYGKSTKAPQMPNRRESE